MAATSEQDIYQWELLHHTCQGYFRGLLPAPLTEGCIEAHIYYILNPDSVNIDALVDQLHPYAVSPSIATGRKRQRQWDFISGFVDREKDVIARNEGVFFVGDPLRFDEDTFLGNHFMLGSMQSNHELDTGSSLWTPHIRKLGSATSMPYVPLDLIAHYADRFDAGDMDYITQRAQEIYFNFSALTLAFSGYAGYSDPTRVQKYQEGIKEVMTYFPLLGASIAVELEGDLLNIDDDESSFF